MKLPDSDFSPSIFHPYYFIRNGLKTEVAKYSNYMKGKMLDFGCGSKPYLSLFSVDSYIGVDFENEGHPHVNEQIDVYYDGTTLPFEDASFDSILCSEVFEHVFNLPDILRELNRVLKPGGNILITCPFVWNEHEIPHDFARYTQFALESLLHDKGFEIVEYSKSGNFISAIVQLTTLYFKITFTGLWRKIFFLRWFYKFSCFFMPNIIGKVLQKLLPLNQSLYLNNVVVAKKRH